MEKKDGQIKVINFARQQRPVYSEAKFGHKEWIFWGEDNMLPNYYVDLYKNSFTNNTALNSKTRFAFGEGFKLEKENNDFLNRVNSEDENINDILKKAAFDYNLLGCFALNIIWSNDRKSIAEIRHMDASLVRAGKADMLGDIKEYYFSNDWSIYGQRKKENKPIRLPIFDPNNREEASQIYYYKVQRPGCYYYSYPDYEGGVASIETEIEIANFQLNNTRRGFAPSFSINFNNVPSPDEMDKVYRDFLKKYEGTDNAGKIILTFSEPGNAPVITPLETNANDKKFETLKKDVTEAILISHAITSPMLFGIRIEGQLGGRSEIIEAFEIFQNTIAGEIQGVLEKEFFKFLKFAGVTEIMRIQPFKLINPINLTLSENSLLQVLTKNEIREMLGLQPVVEGPTASEAPTGEPDEQPMPDAELKKINDRLTILSKIKFNGNILNK